MSTKELEIVIDTITAANRRFTYNETLTLENVEEPQVINAYFAEKTVKEESLKDGTYQYTFDKDTSTDSKTKRSNVAKAIHKSINDELSSQNKEVRLADITKVINIKETGKKWPLQSHAKDSTLTFDQYKNETKIYYKKITSAPMGYQVYLVTETKNLKDKKVKIKIHEKESDLKLLKTKDDILPVLVFAKKEDTTTETETSDWIEIDVKEENGNKENGNLFLYKEANENKIEVGIKKIQLRPKEDKIKTEGEDAHKSFEGWQETLYIREDETEEGKKAIKDAEALAETRKNETFITLTRDAEADKKENKKSFPKKVSGPEAIGVLGKDAVFTIDEYKSTATTADKNNIRWCIYVDQKSTTIDVKSKSGLYTYAKCELVDVVETTATDGTVTKTGGTNKLTIVFDKALEGKTIQIEPFRGSPDHKVSKDWVYENTVKSVKIQKRDTSSFWLTTQCESVKSPGDMIDKEFKSYFKLKTPDTIHIYYDGHITKLNFEALKKVKYRYHDKNGDKHNFGVFDLFQAQKWKNGSKSYHKGWKKVVSTDNDGSKINRYYEYDTGKINLIKFRLPISYKNQGVKLSLKDNSSREYINPEAYACLLGAIAENDFPDLTLNGFTSKDGTGAPSVTHYNGIAGDFRYLRKDKKIKSLHINTSPNELDVTRQDKFIDALMKFGWAGFLSYDITLNGKSFRLDHTTHKAHHHHHLHLNKGSFSPNYKQ